MLTLDTKTIQKASAALTPSQFKLWCAWVAAYNTNEIILTDEQLNLMTISTIKATATFQKSVQGLCERGFAKEGFYGKYKLLDLD